MEKRELENSEFRSIFLRSLFIQSVWNYESMLSIGLTYALLPVARKLFKLKNEISGFLLRHLGFFNSHPYFASFAIGAIARAEMENNPDRQKIDRLKNALIGPLGALGDQLFWATIRPASVMLAMCGVILLPGISLKIISIFFALLIYNIPHLYVRWHGLIVGYRNGFQVYKDLSISNYERLYHLFLYTGAGCLGLIIGAAIKTYMSMELWEPVLFAFALGCAYFLSGYRKSYYLICLLTFFLTTIIGIIIESV